ncbi:MAG: hypothetical protein ACRDT6_11110 [Micromonosporaceae bacterium]
MATDSAGCDDEESGNHGLQIVDVTDIQARVPNPQTHVISAICWADGSVAMQPLPVTIKGKHYIIFTDEGGGPLHTSPVFDLTCCSGSARLIDISDETAPKVVAKFKLEIQLPAHADTAVRDSEGNGVFGYQAHYCNVDRLVEPTVLGCTEFDSGIRVFDIRNPLRPREIAYFIPPAQLGKNDQLSGSEHASNPINQWRHEEDSDNLLNPYPKLNADWCTAQVRFVPERGELWTSCLDNGFLTLKFTNGVWPFSDHRTQSGPTSSSG